MTRTLHSSRGRCMFLLAFVVVCWIFALLRSGDQVLNAKEEHSSFLRNTSTLGHYEELKEGPSPMLETKLPGHGAALGFTFVDRLYARNGVFYIVTYNSTFFPPKREMISRPLWMGEGYDLEPTDEDLQFISPIEAQTILGEHFLAVDGVSVIIHDPSQFLNHYYHWWGEIILGFWRMYAALGLYHGFTTEGLPPPDRFILPNTHGDWRDGPEINAPLMRAAFPSSTIQEKDYWTDHIQLNVTIAFERAIIISRETAHRHPLSAKYAKMIGSTMEATVPASFWEPLRKMTVRNVLGTIPRLDDRGVVAYPAAQSSRPVVAYVSRQKAGLRKFRQADHERLIAALRELDREGIAEVKIVCMEDMKLREQMELAARTTIMLGIHGNGLTHQLWMPPTTRSTVIEIFNPKNYLFDYEILARNMAHKHYAVWNDTIVPASESPDTAYGDDNLNSIVIPIHIPTVISLIRERLE